MSDTIVYRSDLIEVDWEQLKRSLNRDRFDNGRSPDQLQSSFENSRHTVLAYAGESIIGTARALSDGVCNAHIVDAWTQSEFRRQGIGTRMVQLLLDNLTGQHVSLFTEDHREFYEQLGFREEPTGLSQVVGNWLQQSTT